MLLPALLAVVASASPGGEESRLEDGYALTLSGGVSLGSYEAGLNWALVRVFRADMGDMLLRRRPRLVGVTGASAGSINALLVAALYCETAESAARDEATFGKLGGQVRAGLEEIDDDRAGRGVDRLMEQACRVRWGADDRADLPGMAARSQDDGILAVGPRGGARPRQKVVQQEFAVRAERR